MTRTTPAISDLAREIVSQEPCLDGSCSAPGSAALRAIEKLRTHLARYFGVVGYRALLNRAIALAAPERPCLGHFRVQTDGTLVAAEKQAPDEDAFARLELLAQLLVLLETFVGETLMLRLVQDIWPAVGLNFTRNGSNAETEAAQ